MPEIEIRVCAEGSGLRFDVTACKKAFSPLNAWLVSADRFFQRNQAFSVCHYWSPWDAFSFGLLSRLTSAIRSGGSASWIIDVFWIRRERMQPPPQGCSITGVEASEGAYEPSPNDQSGNDRIAEPALLFHDFSWHVLHSFSANC
ncbi:hypothetical protein [Pseudomonas defluvii]|uniref:hypothetical protein n=1 Tax=Pseudomonas defluvii TaxID=1876757 RepID=UPI003905A765